MSGSRASGTRKEPRRSAGPVDRLTLVVLVLLTAWAIGYQLTDTLAPSLINYVPFSGLWPDVAFGFAGGLLICGGRRPEAGWRLLGLGCVCWALGDVYWNEKLVNLGSLPAASWADAGYLSFYPFAILGIVAFVRNHLRIRSRMLIADACAAGLAAAAISAAVVLDPVLASVHGTPLAVSTNLAYPVGDLTVLGLVIGASALDDWRMSRTWMLLGASIVCFWVADSCYLRSVATSTYSLGDAYNGLWYVTPVIAAWAAWIGFEPVHSSEQQARASGARVRSISMLLVVSCASLTILVWSGLASLGVPAIVLAACSLLVVMLRLVMTWRENVVLLRLTQREALTDPVTGLHNRRALAGDIEKQLRAATDARPVALILFDLDGFKYYNDNFGHLAGDALLRRLGHNLALALGAHGAAYRMGGDEFCALVRAPLSELPGAIEAAATALSEVGEGFVVTCSYGTVVLPEEADDISAALLLADQRMYMQKRGSRASASRQSGDVLLSVLQERDPELRSHLHDVAQLATAIARRFEVSADELETIQQAGELHDVGKMAIPDAILAKEGPLDEAELEFIHRHTLIGERIIAAAPALHRVSTLVRSCHENFDGTGYPDGLAGEEIPLGSRIVAVCDAFHAIIRDRPYRGALTEPAAIDELRRCAGTQLDPKVVERCIEVLVAEDDAESQSPRSPRLFAAHV